MALAEPAAEPAQPLSAGQFCAMRLKPGEDLKESLLELCRHMAAASVVTCVGSLQKASIRLADANRERSDQELHLDEKLEITSLVGTLGSDGGHLHISVANKVGIAVGIVSPTSRDESSVAMCCLVARSSPLRKLWCCTCRSCASVVAWTMPPAFGNCTWSRVKAEAVGSRAARKFLAAAA
eukprot:s660_g7.t1